jgi:enoyl-CoA hydratase/carnithine racemase
VAGEDAMFGFVDTNLHVPFRVASVLLPRMTLLGTALDLFYSGARIGAAQMREIGLVSELAPKGQSRPGALELAHAIARRFGPGRDVRKQEILALSGVPLPAAMQSARRLR